MGTKLLCWDANPKRTKAQTYARCVHTLEVFSSGCEMKPNEIHRERREEYKKRILKFLKRKTKILKAALLVVAAAAAAAFYSFLSAQ